MSIHRTFLACSGLIFLLCLAGYSHAADGQRLLRKGIDAYEAGDYRDAADILEQATSRTEATTEYYLWLGRSYGRLAEQSNFLNALSLAIKTRRNLERAVELDEHNIAAMEDLLAFYSQAPALVGGGHDKAENLRERLAAVRESQRHEPGKLHSGS
ncbi:MAG: hypothetical protein WD709_02310 [Gammaproteobacteria bacterium]